MIQVEPQEQVAALDATVFVQDRASHERAVAVTKKGQTENLRYVIIHLVPEPAADMSSLPVFFTVLVQVFNAIIPDSSCLNVLILVLV